MNLPRLCEGCASLYIVILLLFPFVYQLKDLANLDPKTKSKILTSDTYTVPVGLIIFGMDLLE